MNWISAGMLLSAYFQLTNTQQIFRFNEDILRFEAKVLIVSPFIITSNDSRVISAGKASFQFPQLLPKMVLDRSLPEPETFNQSLKFQLNKSKELKTPCLTYSRCVQKNKPDKIAESFSPWAPLLLLKPNVGSAFPGPAYIKQGGIRMGLGASFHSFPVVTQASIWPCMSHSSSSWIDIQKAGRHESNNNESVSEKITSQPFRN